MSDNINDYLKQERSTLVCLRECEVTIDLTDYTEKKNIDIRENSVWLSSLICKIEFADKMFNIILDYPVEIIFEPLNFEHKKRSYIRIDYKAGDVILVIPEAIQEIAEQALYVERLMSGKEVFKSVDHLLLKLYKVYQKISNMDLVHMECLLSNCLRYKGNQSYPARLGKKWDPVLLNIKKVVFAGGFMQGLAFENIGEAIKTGLTISTELEPSIIEKVLTGTIVEEETK
jgi:hypothetical protein